MENMTQKRILSFDEFVSQGETGMDQAEMPVANVQIDQTMPEMPGAENAPAPAEMPAMQQGNDDTQLMLMDEPAQTAETPEEGTEAQTEEA